MEANNIFYSVIFFLMKEVKELLVCIAAKINLDAMYLSLFICSPSFISYPVFFLD